LEQTLIRGFLEICWKSRFVCDLEDFNFLQFEILGTCEEDRCGGVVGQLLDRISEIETIQQGTSDEGRAVSPIRNPNHQFQTQPQLREFASVIRLL
jgi:hypothetical protein